MGGTRPGAETGRKTPGRGHQARGDPGGEPTFADAILDRIVHNAYRLELSGQSLRKTMAKTGDENCQR